jgi:hypothetical protein
VNTWFQAFAFKLYRYKIAFKPRLKVYRYKLGMFPVDHFSAILNPPQGAIMAVGRGVDKVVMGGAVQVAFSFWP